MRSTRQEIVSIKSNVIDISLGISFIQGSCGSWIRRHPLWPPSSGGRVGTSGGGGPLGWGDGILGFFGGAPLFLGDWDVRGDPIRDAEADVGMADQRIEEGASRATSPGRLGIFHFFSLRSLSATASASRSFAVMRSTSWARVTRCAAVWVSREPKSGDCWRSKASRMKRVGFVLPDCIWLGSSGRC